MGNIYIVRDRWDSEPMDRVRCDNEERELQLLLEKNLDILPGDQINPDDPRRWLLVKLEMPVPDPSTGIDAGALISFWLTKIVFRRSWSASASRTHVHVVR